MRNIITSLLVIIIAIFLVTCQKQSQQDPVSEKAAKRTKMQADEGASPKIVFVELGSVNCIPCRMMQPVMQNIEHKYGSQIKVIFYDVWKEENKKYAQKYGIRLIPTQVFLDSSGKEIMRHEGFFPEEEIDAFLQKNGLKPLQ